MPRSYAIGAFAEELGVHPETVKRWCRSGDLDYTRTPGGDRRIPHRELLRLAGADRPRDRVALYARVSSHGQKDNGDLERQLERLLDHHGVTITVIEDETDKTAQQELVDDLIELVASFSGTLYGMRSNKKQRVVTAVESEVNVDGCSSLTPSSATGHPPRRIRAAGRIRPPRRHPRSPHPLDARTA